MEKVLDNGMNIVEIMDLLGHENISTTVGYLRLSKKFYKKLNQIILLLFYLYPSELRNAVRFRLK